MIQRRKFRTEKARKRERIRLAGKVFGMVTGAVLCVVLFTYFLHGQKLRLEQITIETSGVLEKDLLAPYSEQAQKMEEERHYLVHICHDHENRPIASSRLEKFCGCL